MFSGRDVGGEFKYPFKQNQQNELIFFIFQFIYIIIMFLSKSQSNISSASNLFNLSLSDDSEKEFKPRTLKLVKDEYFKFMTKLGNLFEIDHENLDEMYKKIHDCVQNDTTKSSDRNIEEMFNIATRLKQNHQLLENLVTALAKRQIEKRKVITQQTSESQQQSQQKTEEHNTSKKGNEIASTAPIFGSRNQVIRAKIKKIKKNVQEIKEKLNQKPQKESVTFSGENSRMNSRFNNSSRGSVKEVEELQKKNENLTNCLKKISKKVLKAGLTLQDIDQQNGRRDTLISLNLQGETEEEVKEKPKETLNCRKVESKIDIQRSIEKKKCNIKQISDLQERMTKLFEKIETPQQEMKKSQARLEKKSQNMHQIMTIPHPPKQTSEPQNETVKLQKTVPRFNHCLDLRSSFTPTKQMSQSIKANQSKVSFTPTKIFVQSHVSRVNSPTIQIKQIRPTIPSYPVNPPPHRVNPPHPINPPNRVNLPPYPANTPTQIRKKPLLKKMQFKQLQQSVKQPRILMPSSRSRQKSRSGSRRHSGINVYSKVNK